MILQPFWKGGLSQAWKAHWNEKKLFHYDDVKNEFNNYKLIK